jgi:hypothetical protein
MKTAAEPHRIRRSQSLSGRPRKRPAERVEARSDGGVRISMQFVRPRWQRFLGGSERASRRFDLDRFGADVYRNCTGSAPVKKIARQFAEKYSVSTVEAELAVTRFLRLLMRKGLIVMEVEREHEEERS